AAASGADDAAPTACGSDAASAASGAPKRKRRRQVMNSFAGLDVSIEETAICVVDEHGEVLCRAAVPTDPAAIARVLEPWATTLKRVGHEAGALSPWLHPELKAIGMPVVCL